MSSIFLFLYKYNVTEIGLCYWTGCIDWGEFSRLLPEDGERIQSPKRCVLKYKQDGVLDKSRTMDNVHKVSNCINVPSLRTFKSYLGCGVGRKSSRKLYSRN
jgi:hypothetical protein